MQVDLQGQVAVVTGAAQGIGRAIAEALLRNGARVVLSDVQEEKGRATAAELGPEAFFVPCDISDAARVRALFAAVEERYGRLDIAVNNAGINSGSPEERVTVDEYSEELWHRIVNVDLNGTFYCCKIGRASCRERV